MKNLKLDNLIISSYSTCFLCFFVNKRFFQITLLQKLEVITANSDPVKYSFPWSGPYILHDCLKMQKYVTVLSSATHFKRK